MNDNYIEVINLVIEEENMGLTKEEIEDYKRILRDLVFSEKEYEFNDDRPRIKTLLESLIR